MSLENRISCNLAALVCTLFRVSTVLSFSFYHLPTSSPLSFSIFIIATPSLLSCFLYLYCLNTDASFKDPSRDASKQPQRPSSKITSLVINWQVQYIPIVSFLTVQDAPFDLKWSLHNVPNQNLPDNNNPNSHLGGTL
jgi:hypothetical protein